MRADTIYALSSGSPPAAVAVVRVSGPRAQAALERLAGRLPEPRRATLATLRRDDGEPLDRALVLRLPAPGSATGEDMAELHLHGGRAVVAAVLAALARIDGLRSAEPGEFTRRAFENGRIDLAEAEGLADLLAAETESQRRAALAVAGGALSRQVENWRERLLALAAGLEAALDFSEEGEVGEAWPIGWMDAAAALEGDLSTYLSRPPAERLRDGVRVVIAGPPNSGKSSLINYLSQREAAITSATPGTTRDIIEVPVTIGGVPFVLTDTAGVRETADEVEAIGVDRARASARGADILLWLGAPADAPSGSAHCVQSKRDLGAEPAEGVAFHLSTVTGDGVHALVDHLVSEAECRLPTEGEVVVNARQRSALAAADASLRAALETSDMLLAAENLRAARVALDAVAGRAGVEDLLDALFGRFCIGK